MTESAQLWYYKYEMNNGEPSWRDFVRLVQKRFGPTMTDTPLGSLALLRHAGKVVDYSNKFMHLACREAELSELQQVQGRIQRGGRGASAPPTPMLSIGAPTSPPKENFGIVKRRKKKNRGRRREREKREGRRRK